MSQEVNLVPGPEAAACHVLSCPRAWQEEHGDLVETVAGNTRLGSEAQALALVRVGKP